MKNLIEDAKSLLFIFVFSLFMYAVYMTLTDWLWRLF